MWAVRKPPLHGLQYNKLPQFLQELGVLRNQLIQLGQEGIWLD